MSTQTWCIYAHLGQKRLPPAARRGQHEFPWWQCSHPDIVTDLDSCWEIRRFNAPAPDFCRLAALKESQQQDQKAPYVIISFCTLWTWECIRKWSQWEAGFLRPQKSSHLSIKSPLNEFQTLPECRNTTNPHGVSWLKSQPQSPDHPTWCAEQNLWVAPRERSLGPNITACCFLLPTLNIEW